MRQYREKPDPSGTDPEAATWTRVSIVTIEDLSDAVLGAGLEAVQLSRAPITGSLAFGEHDGVICSTGMIRGRVSLKGPLSEDQVTFGLGLRIPPGSRHWLTDVFTGSFGVFLPGDDHDALYAPGSFYATVTLSADRLEAATARAGLVLDTRTLGGTGFHRRRVEQSVIDSLEVRFADLHVGRTPTRPGGRPLPATLLDTAIAHFARTPRPPVGRRSLRGRSRIVARAREYAHENLNRPISIDAMAQAAFTSRRTLHRAFRTVLDESPQSYVRKVRLNRIRRDLASESERRCTVSLVAGRWGIPEMGRLAGWYRDLFGELPSETLILRADPRSERKRPSAP